MAQFFVFVIWVILVFKQFSQKRISKEVGGFGRCCKDKSQGYDSWYVSLRVTEVPDRNLTVSPDSLSFSLLEKVCIHHELDVPEQDWTLPFSDSDHQVRGLGSVSALMTLVSKTQHRARPWKRKDSGVPCEQVCTWAWGVGPHTDPLGSTWQSAGSLSWNQGPIAYTCQVTELEIYICKSSTLF